MAHGVPRRLRPRGCYGLGGGRLPPRPSNDPGLLVAEGSSGRVRLRSKIVTWLILPVVICLSQGLSHACLSISNYTVKLRMAQPYYMGHSQRQSAGVSLQHCQNVGTAQRKLETRSQAPPAWSNDYKATGWGSPRLRYSLPSAANRVEFRH